MLMEKERRSIYDYIRVIACIGVIGIHVILDREDLQGVILETFFRIWLPMFFLISGALLLASPKEESVGKFYLKRFDKVIIPFSIYGIVYYGWINQGQNFVTKPSMDAVKHMIKLIPAALKDNFMQMQYFHLWFMYAIIGIYILMPFLKKGLQAMDEKMLLWLAAVILIMQCCQDYLPLFGITFGVENHFCNWVIYVIFGYILVQEFVKKRYIWVILAGAAAAFASFLVKYRFRDYISDNYYDLAPHMLLQVCGMFALFMVLEKWIVKCRILNRIVAWVSKYTFSIYMIHGFILFDWINRHGNLSATLKGAAHEIVVVFAWSFLFAFVFDNVVTFNVQRLFRLAVRAVSGIKKKPQSVQ